jgi:hypothetical protein
MDNRQDMEMAIESEKFNFVTLRLALSIKIETIAKNILNLDSTIIPVQIDNPDVIPAIMRAK